MQETQGQSLGGEDPLEEEILKMIRENDNPGQAMVIAIDTILEYLTQHGSSGVQAVAGLQELI